MIRMPRLHLRALMITGFTAVVTMYVLHVTNPMTAYRTLSMPGPLERYCSYDDFVRYFRENDSLPSQGTWDDADNFQPEFCKLRNRTMPPGELRKCFQKKNVKHVMTFGDSNGKAFFRAAVRAIDKAFPNCNQTRIEKLINRGFDPQPSYYCLGDKDMEAALVTQPRGCRTCVSSDFVCVSGRERFSIEHISMARIIDYSLGFRKNVTNYTAGTMQEIILKYYVPKVKPDLILLYVPFNHLARRGNYKLQQQYMSVAYKLFKTYAPNITVFWMPGFGEIEKAKKKGEMNHKYQKMFPTDAIQKFNNDMFKMLKNDLIDKSSNVKSFFDILPMSLSRAKWARDGVHMFDIWYDKVFDFWSQTYCE